MSKRIIIIATVTALIIAAVQMLYEGISPTGAGFWATPIFISAILITGALSVDFSFAPVVVGFALQIAILISLGIINEEIFRKIKTRTKKVIASISFSLLVFVLVRFFIIPTLDPVMLNLNEAVFFICHIIWGAMLGFMSKLNIEEISEVKESRAQDLATASVVPVENIDKNDPMALSDPAIPDITKIEAGGY